MRSRKQIWSGKRMLAGILAAMMVVSSVQLPSGSVWAAELSEDTIITDSAINSGSDQTVAKNQETVGLDEDVSSVEENRAGEDHEGAAAPTGGEESGGHSEGANPAADRGNEASEPGEEEGASPDQGKMPSDDGDITDGEDALGDGNKADGEDPSDDGNKAAGEDTSESGDDAAEADDSGDEDAERLAEGLLYPAQISENDIIAIEEPEIIEYGELDGAYQFGGAPAKRGNLSVYAEASYGAGAEEYVYEQMLARSGRIDLTAYKLPYDNSGVEALSNLVYGVLNVHPELYFVERRFSYSSNGSIITAVLLTYGNTYDDAAFQRNVATALSRVSDQMSDLEKAIILHDYLTVNCEYDYENLNAGTVPTDSYNAYGTLVKRIAVCHGYALAYKYLLNQAGIDCYMVTSDSMNHAWNLIVLDGEYYQVDVTWDDPTWDKIGRSVHTYMFRSDAAFAEHHDWEVTSGSNVVDYEATDTRYDNAFWTDCDSPLVFNGDDCYYVAYDTSTRQCAVKKGTLANLTGSGETLQSIDRWTVWGGGGSWQGAYSGLFRIGDRLYYNDKTSIYSIALDGTDKRTEFTADTTEGYIYGSAYCQGEVRYALHQTPNITEKETVLVADMTVEGDDPVNIPVQYVKLSVDTLTLEEGEEAELTATVYPTYATDAAVVWTSDDEAVAEVAGGSVRAISAGSCTITATAGGQKAECTVQVTAKESDTALDLDNLSDTYTALDDTQISSTANGKPKLLIFYSNTCGNCRSTIRGISEQIADFAGIDIYAIETTQATKEEVATYQETYGCEEITFSYDVTSGNENSMWAYIRAVRSGAGSTINATWPVICYIDADNRLQCLTMGWYEADEILSNLQKYCGMTIVTPQTYTITYILNGGTNSTENPATYTAATATFTLCDAVRDGYQFDGWYKDAAYTQRVTQIVKGSTGNLTLYAKWSPVQTGGLPEVDMTPTDGNVIMGFSGTYYTETADKILDRLNAIRLEACQQGFQNPSTGEPLTEADYVPLKWSADMEAIARLRAAEASVDNSHTRLNGTSCFTARTTNGEQSWAENLAWNYDGLMEGIEQWYEEKSDWVNQTGATTGHYTSIINPYNTYVGVSAFRLSSGGWYSVAQEFSFKDSMDERKHDSHGTCVQYMEV
ncbi:MAG: InlB B-repeat-containing protein, partial [Muribaculaceae bacterium]|nr:InlB B-repeat-containing protein [Muribaculaceae bacterium]